MITEVTRERLAALERYVRERGHGRWLVLMHDNPDPDALASAAALALVLRRAFHRHVVAAHGGIIGRAENRELVKALGLELEHVRGLSWKSFKQVALVDTQPRTGNNQLPETTVPALVVDHHPPRRASQAAPLADIRRGYGATATILAEYLLASGIRPTRRLATALVYAIRTETQDFARESTGPDREIHDLLLPRVDKRLLARILHPALPLSYFRNLQQGLQNLESVGSLVVSHLGPVEQPDIVPEVADLLVRLEGKSWSLATGVFGDRLYLSIRALRPRADAGRLMRRLLGKRGKGGGHGMAAGGWIGLDKAPGGDPDALARQLAARLAVLLGKPSQKLQPLAAEAPGEPSPVAPAPGTGDAG
jgi:nanoRNase/pAp phosphatase (c-di-AMP/oligoRNAs hydrolase)